MAMNSLNLFDPLTAGWFTGALGNPTAVQEEAWPAIASGRHTLVSAPTGTGKTLSAFLVFIDRLKAQARAGILEPKLQLIYISPLKSLAGDIRENLQKPLYGILEEERKSNPSSVNFSSEISIEIRTGDTPQKDRRRMLKHPPHILITTPESLYLLLTSLPGQKMLSTAGAVIIDELHAIIDSKRGAHLMLSLARLDRLCKIPLQRIGLSATIEPLSEAAKYLAPEAVTIVAPRMKKEVRLMVTSPLFDTRLAVKDSVWQELANTVYDYCLGSRSVIAFVEGRAYAEKLAYYVNQLGGDGFARTHHGSLSKEKRLEVEQSLREGNLRLLCATSSMELGIDVGEIDQVFQIGCPRSISSTMQRLGRAGHNPGRVSIMHIFPRSGSEALYCGLTAEVATNGGVEYSRPPRLCLDVLAQHLVSMAAGNSYTIEEVMEVLSRAYPFYEVTREDVKDILGMLAGDYEHEQDIPVRPRILYDRIHERVEPDSYSRMLAVSAGGTIPDKGLFSVKTENGVKLGEVDEEFVFEAHVGDKFLLGAFSWQINRIEKDSVIVTSSNMIGTRPPFYKGEIKGRRLRTGIAFGKILRRLGEANETNTLLQELNNLGLDEKAAKDAGDILERQLALTGVLPDDRTIITEHFLDSTGVHQIMVHSVFGRQVNEPLSILTRETARRLTNTHINSVDDDDGFLLFPYGNCELPEGLLQQIRPETAKKVLEAILPATPAFNMTFRYNCARALMMGVKKAGRQPLWVQRLRSASMLDSLVRYEKHPLIRETKRECLEDYWDLEGLEYVLNGIRSGNIRVCELHLDSPSPMSLQLRFQTEASMMYDYSPTPEGIHVAVNDALKQARMIAPAPEQLALVSERKYLPEDEKQLHSLLMIEGDLVAGEMDVPVDWLEALAGREQTEYIEPGLWIAAEHKAEYQRALTEANQEARLHIVRRLLRYRQAWSCEQLAQRYLWTDEEARQVLDELVKREEAVESDGLYYHAKLYDRARQETVKSRRRQINTLPAESYAALLTGRMSVPAPPEQQLFRAIKALCDQPYPPALWESVILPARVKGYRPELLDTVLGQGNLFWRITEDQKLCFHIYDDIDWEADLTTEEEHLKENEKVIYHALLIRGASFIQRLTGLLENISPYDILLSLAQKGLVTSDSFIPVRQWMNREKLLTGAVRQRISAKARAMTAGRWELSRPLKELTAEEKLEREFDRAVILSRETLQGMSWGSALETLRIWEYIGRVRWGYFIEGLSGIQFVREKDFTGVMQELEHPGDEIVWVSSSDPAQPWGKYLPHKEDRAFLNVPGTAVALQAGQPLAVFERQGKVLRVFEIAAIQEVLQSFVRDFSRRRIFPGLNRITVKQYPKEAKEAFSGAGFLREMQDYVLYR